MSAGLELGTILRALPEEYQDQPVLCAIHSAYAFRWANRLWSKREAAWLAFRANMERGVAYGHGNRAARRISLLGVNHFYNECQARQIL